MNKESVESIKELLKKVEEAKKELEYIDADDLTPIRKGQMIEMEGNLKSIKSLLEKGTKSYELNYSLQELRDVCSEIKSIEEGVERKRGKFKKLEESAELEFNIRQEMERTEHQLRQECIDIIDEILEKNN